MFWPSGVQVLHITGPGEYETLKAAYADSPVASSVVPFCQEMGLAYAAADVAVSRSGASSLTELSAFGLPVILVPYPTAADDHQRRNADVFTKAGKFHFLCDNFCGAGHDEMSGFLIVEE